LDQEPFGQVTIKQLCLESGVSRQTFYRNYESLEEVMSRYLEKVWLDFSRSYCVSGRGKLKNLEVTYAHLPLSKSLLEKLYSNSLFYLLQLSCSEAFAQIALKAGYNDMLGPNLPPDYLGAFVSSTMSTVLLRWTKGGFKETPSQLARITNIFFKGLRGN
jgi:AcrR family transcriptional regulator